MLQAWRADRKAEPIDTPIFKMPSIYNVARMLHDDLDAARTAWVEDAKTPEECVRREQSDVLLTPDHAGRYLDFHALRHSAVSAMRRAGVPVHVIAEFVGQKTIQVVDRYSHVAGDDLVKAAAAVPPPVQAVPEVIRLQPAG
jgi:integrase